MYPVLDTLPNGITLVRDLQTGKIVQKFTGVVHGRSATDFYFVTSRSVSDCTVHQLCSWNEKTAKAEAKSRRLVHLIMDSEKIPFEEAMSVIGTRDSDWSASVITHAMSNRHSIRSVQTEQRRKVA